jgi:hypothetical protein
VKEVERNYFVVSISIHTSLLVEDSLVVVEGAQDLMLRVDRSSGLIESF